jgi:hypothetical protein
VGQQIGAASVVRTTSRRRRRCHRKKCASVPLHAFGAKLTLYLLSLITAADDFASILSACITSMRCHCACLARCELVNAMIVRRWLEQTHIEFVTFTVQRAYTADTMLNTRYNICITLHIAQLQLQVATVAALGLYVWPL